LESNVRTPLAFIIDAARAYSPLFQMEEEK
jgi:hypothetical protein